MNLPSKRNILYIHARNSKRTFTSHLPTEAQHCDDCLHLPNDMTTKLSVNINKIATLRNSRGGNTPSVLEAAINCEKFGADGITVHPRPDERHIRYSDVREIRPILKTEFNIEGNPREEKFVALVLEVKPEQVTLVPDAPGQLTSNHGWDTITEQRYLTSVIEVFKKAGIRVSIFIDPVEEMILAAKDTNTDRIELYTEDFAAKYAHATTNEEKLEAVLPYIKAADCAKKLNLGLNAGHDLNMDNLSYFKKSLPDLLEVSIGHALIADALYYGLENTIQIYKRRLLTI
jgi:pyridoxine 5-phosphate synthase